MVTHHLYLLFIQFSGLEKNRVGNANLPHVVHGRGMAYDLDDLFPHVHLARHYLGKPTYAGHVVGCVTVLEFTGQGQAVDGVYVGLVNIASGYPHICQRLAKVSGAVLDHALQLSTVSLDLILSDLEGHQPPRAELQLSSVDRFADYIVDPEIESPEPVFTTFQPGDHYDRNVADRLVTADASR